MQLKLPIVYINTQAKIHIIIELTGMYPTAGVHSDIINDLLKLFK